MTFADIYIYIHIYIYIYVCVCVYILSGVFRVASNVIKQGRRAFRRCVGQLKDD